MIVGKFVIIHVLCSHIHHTVCEFVWLPWIATIQSTIWLYLFRNNI